MNLLQLLENLERLKALRILNDANLNENRNRIGLDHWQQTEFEELSEIQIQKIEWEE